MIPRRAQTPVAIRSDRAAKLLGALTRNGRSQAEVIEVALEQLSLREAESLQTDDARRRQEIEAILDRFATARGSSMAEFDRLEYGTDGNPR